MIVFEIVTGICTASILVLYLMTKNNTLDDNSSESIGSIIVLCNIGGLLLLSLFTVLKLLKSIWKIGKMIRAEGFSTKLFLDLLVLPFNHGGMSVADNTAKVVPVNKKKLVFEQAKGDVESSSVIIKKVNDESSLLSFTTRDLSRPSFSPTKRDLSVN